MYSLKKYLSVVPFVLALFPITNLTADWRNQGPGCNTRYPGYFVYQGKYTGDHYGWQGGQFGWHNGGECCNMQRQGGYNGYNNGYYSPASGQYGQNCTSGSCNVGNCPNGQTCNNGGCNAYNNGQTCNNGGCNAYNNGQPCNNGGCNAYNNGQTCNNGGCNAYNNGQACCNGACNCGGQCPCAAYNTFQNGHDPDRFTYPYDGSNYYSIYPWLDGF